MCSSERERACGQRVEEEEEEEEEEGKGKTRTAKKRKQHVQMCVRTHPRALAHICAFVPTKLCHIPRSNIYTLFATPYVMYYSLFSSNLEPEIRQIEINDYSSVCSHSPARFYPLSPSAPNLTDIRASFGLKHDELASDLIEVCLRRQL